MVKNKNFEKKSSTKNSTTSKKSSKGKGSTKSSNSFNQGYRVPSDGLVKRLDTDTEIGENTLPQIARRKSKGLIRVVGEKSVCWVLGMPYQYLNCWQNPQFVVVKN